jgi:hypothetical protein
MRCEGRTQRGMRLPLHKMDRDNAKAKAHRRSGDAGHFSLNCGTARTATFVFFRARRINRWPEQALGRISPPVHSFPSNTPQVKTNSQHLLLLPVVCRDLID